MQHWNKLECT